jgi:hypothetical protein
MFVAAVVAPRAARADVTIQVVGTDAKGGAMRGSCALRPLSPPSNTFLGQCELSLGAERIVIAGLDVDGQSVLSAVLDGRITIRGVPRSTRPASERFGQMVTDGAAGFPIYLRIDPFGRAWALERDLPGGGREVVAGGSISEGNVGLGISAAGK